MAQDLTPRGRNESQQVGLGRPSEGPFFTLRREMERLFDDVFRGWNLLTPGAVAKRGWPCLEANETDNDVKVTLELPSLTEKDVELSVDDGMLTIRGERRQEIK